MPDINCHDVQFGDFAFRFGFCDSCSRSSSVLTLNNGCKCICAECLGQGLQLLMKLVNSNKQVI